MPPSRAHRLTTLARRALPHLLTSVVTLWFCAPAAHARDSRPEDSGPDFSVAAQPERVSQGSILRVVVSPLYGPPVTSLQARFGGRTASGTTWKNGEVHALIAIKIDARPGPAMVALRITDGSGLTHQVQLPFTILPGRFDTDELGVSRSFTQPNRMQRIKAKEDARAFEALWSSPTQPRRWRGSFTPPVPAVVTARYGTFRTLNGRAKSRHMGLDLKGAKGDPIFAANDGKVVMARPCFFSGNTVVIDHGQDIYTMYFHLSQFRVKSGDVVKRGTLIGDVGSTGRVTGPHLHFGVKLNTVYVDPAALLEMDLMDDPKRPITRGAAGDQ